MPRLSPYKREQLEEEIFLAQAQHRWSRRTAFQLAAKYGQHWTTIYRTANRLKKRLKEAAGEIDIEAERHHLLASLDGIVVQSLELGKPNAAVAALRLRAELFGLRQKEPVVQVGVSVGANPADLVAEVVGTLPVMQGLLPATVHEEDVDEVDVIDAT